MLAINITIENRSLNSLNMPVAERGIPVINDVMTNSTNKRNRKKELTNNVVFNIL